MKSLTLGLIICLSIGSLGSRLRAFKNIPGFRQARRFILFGLPATPQDEDSTVLSHRCSSSLWFPSSAQKVYPWTSTHLWRNRGRKAALNEVAADTLFDHRVGKGFGKARNHGIWGSGSISVMGILRQL